jgi:hypothetical protein
VHLHILLRFATSRHRESGARRGELRVGDTSVGIRSVRRVVDNEVWAMAMLEQRWMQAGVVWMGMGCDGMGWDEHEGEALLFTGEI